MYGSLRQFAATPTRWLSTLVPVQLVLLENVLSRLVLNGTMTGGIAMQRVTLALGAGAFLCCALAILSTAVML